MKNGEWKVVRKARGWIVTKKRFAETFRFPSRDHSTPSRRNWHCVGPSKNLQLNWSTLNASYAQRDSSIMNFIITKLLEKCVGDLCKTKTFLGLDVERYDGNSIENHRSNLFRWSKMIFHLNWRNQKFFLKFTYLIWFRRIHIAIGCIDDAFSRWWRPWVNDKVL